MKNSAQFAKQLLAKMGYTPERGIGAQVRNKQLEVAAVKPRPERLGLGAQNKEGVKFQTKNQVKAAERVVFVKGKHQGVRGLVLQMGKQSLLVQLDNSFVNVRALKEQVISEKAGSTLLPKRQRSREKSGEYPLLWAREGLVVRIIKKQSRHYMKQGQVVLAHSNSAEVNLGGQLIKVKQKYLQTVLPKQGEQGVVVGGRHRGKKGSLLRLEEGFAIVLLESGAVRLEPRYFCLFSD